MSVENEGQTELSPELEREARSMGWQPKEEFKGDEGHWVSADEFVERGRAVMPILLKNNKRLQSELLTRDSKIDTLTQRLNAADTALEKLERHYSEANKRAVENAKRQLKEELKQARQDNDVDAEFEIQEKLAGLNSAPETAPVVKTVAPASAPPEVSPEFRAWNKENEWFGTDLKKTKAIMRIAEDLREEGTDLMGVEFMDECVRLLEAQNKPAPSSAPAVSKVESNARTPRTSSSGRGFADLPADAKRACHDDADDLVGPNKRFKSLKDWETQYAKIYFAE